MTEKSIRQSRWHLTLVRVLGQGLVLLAGHTVCVDAIAQNAPVNPPPTATPATPATPAESAACPTRADAAPEQALYGRWQVSFADDGESRAASVVLQPHPDGQGGVRGTITRAGLVAQLAGDVGDDGLLTLDESQDGRAISATWSGDLQAGSCGKTFKGIWRNARDDSTLDFVLRKTADEN